MPGTFPIAWVLVFAQHAFVVAGAIVFLLCLTYLWTALPELRFRGLWRCSRCEELGPFFGRCRTCGARGPGLTLLARWLAAFFGPILVVAVIFAALWALRYLPPKYLYAFLLGIPFAILAWTGYALLFGRRMWLCPQCKEPSPFFGKCRVCGQPAPGMMRSVGHLGVVAGAFIILAWAWLAVDLLVPRKGASQQHQTLSTTSSGVSLEEAEE